ncbi:MAG: DUF2098 domain-containing protein [ANME-2 cluster archaeon]|nr:DUF2098 domain-containing protein [ANME-2 cluster archaeon]
MAPDNLVFLDCNGNTLRIGSPVRYTGTGTTGFTTDLVFEECETWVRMDSTGLTYHSSTMVLIDADKVKVKGNYGKTILSIPEMHNEMKRKVLGEVTGADDRNIIGH